MGMTGTIPCTDVDRGDRDLAIAAPAESRVVTLDNWRRSAYPEERRLGGPRWKARSLASTFVTDASRPRTEWLTRKKAVGKDDVLYHSGELRVVDPAGADRPPHTLPAGWCAQLPAPAPPELSGDPPLSTTNDLA